MNPLALSSAGAGENSARSRTHSEPQPSRLFLRRGRGDPSSTPGREEHEPRDEYSLDRKQQKNDKLPDGGSVLPPWRISAVPSVPVVPDNSGLLSSSSSSSNNNTHQSSNIPVGIPGPKNMHTTDYNVVVIGILIAMIVVLSLNMMVLLYRPVTEYCRRKLGIYDSEQKELMERRYKTIDKWMIRKTIQPHDALCEGIQNYARQPNGASPLVAFVTNPDYRDGNGSGNGNGNGHDANNHCNGYRCPNHLNNSTNDDDDGGDCHHRCCDKYQQRPVPVPPLCVAESFETETTRSGSDSSSSSSSTSSSSTSKSLVLNSIDDRSTTSDDQRSVSVSVSANHRAFGGPPPSPSEASSESESASASIRVGCQRLDRMQLLEKIGLVQTARDVVAFEATATTRVAPGEEHATCSAESPPLESKDGDGDGDNDNIDEDEEETSGPLDGGVCSICMEGFEAGDEVSYSPLEGSCNHFFHHDCVREWLLRRKGCPHCREIMLPVDRPECKTNCHDAIPRGGTVNDTDSNVDNDTVDNDNVDNTNIDNASFHRRGGDSSTRLSRSPAAAIRWKQLRQRQRQEQRMQRSERLRARNEQKARFARQRRGRKHGTYVCVDCGLVRLHPELVVCNNSNNNNNKDPCE